MENNFDEYSNVIKFENLDSETFKLSKKENNAIDKFS